jgi:hypothetical protein
MAGFCASLAGTLIFICRFVGLVPKFVTRVSAPLTVAVTTVRATRIEFDRNILKIFLETMIWDIPHFEV